MSAENDKTRKAYRQGELLFVPLNAEEMEMLNPSNESYPRWNKLQTNVIREGEATGHKHEVMTETPGTATLLAPVSSLLRGLRGLPNMDSIGNEDRLLVAEEPVEVVHPEHKPLRLLKGIFLVLVQREYDEVKARRIID